MPAPDRIQLPFSQASSLVLGYLRGRVLVQLRTVALVVVYLVVFQLVILKTPLNQAGTVAGGLGLAVVGLALFLEGVTLGLMPLGELVGARLPRRAGMAMVMLFAFALGLGATFAEPALHILQMVGADVAPWSEPTLYHLINVRAGWLVLTVSAGVGIGAAVGIGRFFFGWSLKPLVVGTSLAMLALSAIATRRPETRGLVGLAWDVGAVTTGPVTVPLVLALGLGVCRSVGRVSGRLAGFGMVAMASLVPSILVLALGMHLASRLPAAMAREAFFGSAQHDDALAVVGSEERFERLRARYQGEARRPEAGSQPVSSPSPGLAEEFAGQMRSSFVEAMRAVVPLVALLLLFALLVLRARPTHGDEVALGLILAVVGMTLLSTGNRFGLTRLGDEVGGNLPASFQEIERFGGGFVVPHFDQSTVVRATTRDGERLDFFRYFDGRRLRDVRYYPRNLDPRTGAYRVEFRIGPVFQTLAAGVLAVMAFACVLGYGATVAEPSLSVMGSKVEEATVGLFASRTLVRAVSVGVGIGMIVGVARIIWDLPLMWLLAPAYLLLVPLTLFSDEAYVNAAWDAAGVTTGPVTVPLVLAMGLGLGNAVEVSDGFGLLAIASAYPIVSVLTMGAFSGFRRRRALAPNHGKSEEKAG